jgi:hypothetical protein
MNHSSTVGAATAACIAVGDGSLSALGLAAPIVKSEEEIIKRRDGALFDLRVTGFVA